MDTVSIRSRRKLKEEAAAEVEDVFAGPCRKRRFQQLNERLAGRHRVESDENAPPDLVEPEIVPAKPIHADTEA